MDGAGERVHTKQKRCAHKSQRVHTRRVELQMRIAFADIGNYMSFGKKELTDPETGIEYKISTVDLKESKNTDTQIIQEVKRGKDGVSIKLADRQKAIDWLTMFFEMNPFDKHRKEFEQRKLELELIKLEMQTMCAPSTGKLTAWMHA